MIGDSDIELIDKYLEGKLSGEDLISFSKRMEVDPQFREEVELQQLTILAIQKKGRADLRNKLSDIANEVVPGEERAAASISYSYIDAELISAEASSEYLPAASIRKYPYKFLAAASVILIFSLGLFYFVVQKNKNENGIAEHIKNNVDTADNKMLYGSEKLKPDCVIKIILKNATANDTIYLHEGRYIIPDSLKVAEWSAIIVEDSVTLALYSDKQFQNLMLGKINGPFQVYDHDTINMKYLSEHTYSYRNGRMAIDISKTKSLEIFCHKKGNLFDKTKVISY